MPNLFDYAMCTIFAREFMEGAIIIGEFRTVIQRSDIPQDANTASKDQMFREVTVSAAIAAFFAVLVVVIVAIPLAVLSKEFDEEVAEWIEGISKVIAALCILQLSLKIPKWMGYYKNKKDGKISQSFDLTMSSIRFNVAWNVWREVAECGVFLLPFFLDGDNLVAIPLSAVIGISVGLAVGFLVYWANQSMKQKHYVCIFVTIVLAFLATGLFVGGCHEFEEILGETREVWAAKNDFWSHKKLPMVILKPFGYSSSRSLLQITTFWCFLGVTAALHCMKLHEMKRLDQELQQLAAENKLNSNSSSSIDCDEPDAKKGAALVKEDVA
jgi:high-affinity iron transporter